jgi:hypothetical protein
VFDQQGTNTQDATADKLYIHAGRLLTVVATSTRGSRSTAGRGR